jgi:hypothetical protein
MSRQANSEKPVELHEGADAFARFDNTMSALLSVSHDELKRREEQYKKQAALNPRKRGPKPKRKS